MVTFQFVCNYLSLVRFYFLLGTVFFFVKMEMKEDENENER